MSELARRLLGKALGTAPDGQPRSVADFSFVAAAESLQGSLTPVSERHDEALAEPE